MSNHSILSIESPLMILSQSRRHTLSIRRTRATIPCTGVGTIQTTTLSISLFQPACYTNRAKSSLLKSIRRHLAPIVSMVEPGMKTMMMKMTSKREQALSSICMILSKRVSDRSKSLSFSYMAAVFDSTALW